MGVSLRTNHCLTYHTPIRCLNMILRNENIRIATMIKNQERSSRKRQVIHLHAYYAPNLKQFIAAIETTDMSDQFLYTSNIKSG